MKKKFRTERASDFNTDIVYVRDIGDRYHRGEYDPSDELLNQALKIRRIYKKYQEYQHAVVVFNDYFGRIVQKYGGPDFFRIALMSGQVDDYLPPIPKLKNKKLDAVFKRNIPMSTIDFKRLDMDSVKEYAETQVDPVKEPLLLAGTNEQRKSTNKVVDKIIDNIIKKASPMSKSKDISVLESYFNKRRVEEEKDLEELVENITLTQLLSDDFYEILDSLDTTDDDALISYNGELIPRHQLESIDAIRELNSLGWNTLKLLNAINANSKILAITKTQNKEQKKALKRAKKAESYMAKALTDNKYSSLDDMGDGFESLDSKFDRFRD